jgi:hypothetical protein
MKAAPALSTTERVSIARHWPGSRGRASALQGVGHVPRSELYPEIDQTGKGEFKGKCNRTACEERGEDVKWWNRPMRAFYCSYCRREISRFDDYRGTPQQIFENHPRTDADTPADGRED